MFKGAYLGKLLRINLTTREYRGEDVNPDELKMLLGGRGLAAGYYFHEIGAELNPFDPENRVIFFTGPLTGLPLPSTTKFQLATKSPETGMYLCSNSGGSLGPQLKRCGYDGLIVEGRSERWCYLAIRDDRVTFADAEPWLGYDSPSTLEAIRDAMDDRLASALSIGPAAERLVRLSCINVDSRAFGPWGDPARHIVVTSEMDCIPCNRLDYTPAELHQHPCMRNITVEQVLEAVERLIETLKASALSV